MNKINYLKIEEYNKKNDFYNYIRNYIEQFKNRKDVVELSYLCANETLELIKENKELYEKCVKCLELIKLWLKDQNSINMQKLEEIVNSIYSISNSVNSISYSVNSISYSAYSIYYSANSIYIVSSALFYVYKTKPELLPYIQNLIKIYLRQEEQFNIKEHNNTYYEKILKQIINAEYNQLDEVDKNQAKDIINEYYDIEINQFDFLVYKTIQREFV